jgi:hypothetical protein
MVRVERSSLLSWSCLELGLSPCMIAERSAQRLCTTVATVANVAIREKKSNWDLVVRVPLMIHVPWLPKSFGQRTSSLVELVDVFPTAAAIAGLPAPADVDGVDVSSLLHASPNSATSVSERLQTELQAAYHQYPACGCTENGTTCFNQTRAGCNNSPRTNFGFMGMLSSCYVILCCF